MASGPRSPGWRLSSRWVSQSAFMLPTVRPPPLPSVAQVRVWLRGAVSLTVMHLACCHHRVKRSSFSRARRREAGRQPTPPRRGPGSGNSHPSSTPSHPHPELKHRDSRAGEQPGHLYSQLGQAPPPGWSGSTITAKHAGSPGPSLASFPGASGLRAPSPITAASGSKGRPGGQGEGQPGPESNSRPRGKESSAEHASKEAGGA